MSKERLEEIKAQYHLLTRNGYDLGAWDDSFSWLIEQAERVQELETSRKEIAKSFRAIWTENKRYKQALEFYADRSIYNFETETDFDAEETRIINEGHIFKDFGERARKALEGDEE